MTDASGLAAAGTPQACTLPEAERPARLAEFDALFRAVIAHERLSERSLRLILDGTDDLADQVRDLVSREADCCSFLSFAVADGPAGQVVLDIEVQEGYTGVLDAWTGWAVGGRHSG
jgi:hypothetical protein